MKNWCFILLVLATGCKKEDSTTNPSAAENPPILISTGFSDGSKSITNSHSSNAAVGFSNSIDISTFDSIQVTWKTTFNPFPATGTQLYTVGLYQKDPETVFYNKPPSSSQQSYLIVIPKFQIVNPQNVSFRLYVGSNTSPTDGTYTGSDFSIYGWKH